MRDMRKILMPICLTAAAVMLAACADKAPINTSDATQPKAELLVRPGTGQYVAAADAKYPVSGNDPLDYMCKITDANGVKQAKLTFSKFSNSCTDTNGSVWNGSFAIDGVAPDAAQTLQGDSSGNVLTTLPILGTLHGPFSCHPPSNKPGAPYGTAIKVTCTGYNWSSDPAKQSASVSVSVKLQ